MAAVQGVYRSNQPLKFNLGESWGTARLMSAWETDAQSQGFECDEGLREDGRRRFKGDDVRNRSRGGSAAEWAVLEMTVRSRMVMPRVRGHRHLIGRGTQFQQKRRAARRHEANRYIGAKQQGDQQQAGEYVASSGIK
jgi:hypothetical protein